MTRPRRVRRTARTPCRAAALANCAFLAACATAPSGGPREVTSWQMANFAIHEECFNLAAGDRIDYEFTSDQPIDFNIHYREGSAVVAPVTREKVTGDSGRFAPLIAQDYCLVWEAGATGALLSFRIQPRRG